MAHNLEIGEDGAVAFALRGAPAWHGLANVLFDEDAHVTTADMLSAAHLDGWNVRLEQVTFPQDYRTISDAFAVVRDNPFDQGTDVLAVVGDHHRMIHEVWFAGVEDRAHCVGDEIVGGEIGVHLQREVRYTLAQAAFPFPPSVASTAVRAVSVVA